MEKRVAIIGAGVSGLLACKYSLEKGFRPIVFEAEQGIGGVWAHTPASTKLQDAKEVYQFSDFPWPDSLKQVIFPTHTQVMEYFEAYAHHFALIPHIKFNCKVLSIDYVNGESYKEIECWDLWNGAGRPFGSNGKWELRVQHTKNGSTQVYHVEFVILCIGRFSGVPNIPDFPPNQGPEVFNGEVMHSMDYGAMEDAKAAEFIRGKKIAVIGSQKSAVDIAVECANANGVEYPCKMIHRTSHWLIPNDYNFLGVIIDSLCYSRFSELFVHKPGETFLLNFLATLLSPLRWGISKFFESYLKWKLPLKKYGMIPNHSFLQEASSCQAKSLPEDFYEKVEEGSIILKKSERFSFCKEGLIIDGEVGPLETDLVILATGYNGDQKLRNIFKSPRFQEWIMESQGTRVPLYRQIIHPRIPQLAIIGYTEGLTNLFGSEVRCQWLVHFLDGNFELPCVKEMEKEVRLWEKYMKQYSGRYYWKACVAGINIWYNNQLCKDMGCMPIRKKSFFAEWFQPYLPTDYAGLTSSSNKCK